jgi:hypothetical protein
VYTIGLGDEPDHDALQALADATGGVHHRVDHPDDVVDTFSLVGDYLTGTHQVCADLDEEVCGALSVRVSWSWTAEGRTAPEHEGTEVQAVTVDCPSEEPTGTRALLLLTLTNPHLPASEAATLTTNTVAHVSPTAAPEVLVVLDDNHHGEFEQDADQVATWLGDAGYAVTRLDETGDGLTDADVEGYDVVWFSNPGYPPDDLATIEVLEAFTAAGGGLVLQGDDMTRGWSNAFSMTSLTSLVYEHNGVQTCGEPTDDNQGERFEVSTFDGHPILAGLESQTWFYGDDIDQTTPLDEGEQVLAEATLEIDPGCTVTPALVVYDP